MSAVTTRFSGHIIFSVILIITWAIFFTRNLAGIYYTGWDTHDLGFTFFLYFSDSLHSGVVPFWNHLIQGGSFHPTFFNAGNYSPFQWIFLSISQLISPIYAFELMIQAVILVGAIGFYFWLRAVGTNKLISIFGAHAFFLSVLMPLVGQIMFLFSLSALPWMLFVCHKAMQENEKIEWVIYLLWATLIASFMASGYPWMNVVNFMLTFLYALNLVFWGHADNKVGYGSKVTLRVVNLIVFFVVSVVVMACYYLPGLYSLNFYYQFFAGDYITPEPRLRSLAPSDFYTFQGRSDAFFASIDPRILKNNTASLVYLPIWSWGVGWVVCLSLFYGQFDKKFIVRNILWIILAAFWLQYSAGALARFIKYLPLFSANRWWFIGGIYVSISLIVLSVSKLQNGIEQDRSYQFNKYSLIVGLILSWAVLKYFSAPVFEYFLVLSVIVTIYYFVDHKKPKQWPHMLGMLMFLNLVAFVSMPHTMLGAARSQHRVSTDPAENYYDRIKSRITDVSVEENHRRLGLSKEYLYNDEDWLMRKVPFSHGYNPLGNPIYWYLKDEPFMDRLVYLTQDVRLEKKTLRKEFSTDNAFANALIKDVQTNNQVPTVDELKNPELRRNPNFLWVLNDFKMEPNLVVMKITVNDAGYLILNNTSFPGWEVLVNGKKDQLISVNRIFQGVYLSGAGDYDVIFKFQPKILIALLIFPSILLLVSLIFVWRKKQLSCFLSESKRMNRESK